MEAAIAQPEALDLPVLLGDWGRALDATGRDLRGPRQEGS